MQDFLKNDEVSFGSWEVKDRKDGSRDHRTYT